MIYVFKYDTLMYPLNDYKDNFGFIYPLMIFSLKEINMALMRHIRLLNAR